jgi:GWxTD domain-containing protein
MAGAAPDEPPPEETVVVETVKEGRRLGVYALPSSPGRHPFLADRTPHHLSLRFALPFNLLREALTMTVHARRALQVFLPLLMVAALLRPAPLHGQSPTLLAARGDTLLALGQVDEARDAYRQALDLADTLTASYLGLARADLEEGKWGDAIDRAGQVLARDTANVEALYYSAIGHREIAKFRTFNQTHHWNTAEQQFEAVAYRNPLFEDVFYQHALLRRYQEQYVEAIALAEKQITLRPELFDAEQGLFMIYRAYVNQAPAEEALAWLQAHDSQYARYFTGEVLRRSGRLGAADSVFVDLLSNDLFIPVQPVLLSRARIFYAQGEEAKGQRLVELAIEYIETPVNAALAFDDFKYIIHADELALYETLSTPEEYKAFFRSFWERRDPMPSRGLNARLSEHYRRLLVAENEYAYYGLRIWHNNPDRRGDLDFPAAYALNDAFNDKGLIFIRHGEPDVREIQVGDDMEFQTVKGDVDPYYSPVEHSSGSVWRPNESWRYYRPQQMDFHFVRTDGANNWRLTPELTHMAMLENREHWGAPYAQMAEAARRMSDIQAGKTESFTAVVPGVASLDEQLPDEIQSRVDSVNRGQRADLTRVADNNRNYFDFTSMRRRMVEQSREAVTLALDSDQHTWQEDIETIDMPHVVSTFRGEGGETEVEIYFALPIGKITERADAGIGTVDIEVGYALHDTAWQAVSQEAQLKRMPTSPDPSAALIDFFRFTVPPDSYHVAIHCAPSETSQLGGYKFGYQVPDYRQPALALSDVVLANYAGPADEASRFNRGDIHLSPNPFQRFSVRQPVYVYFEVYHLGLDGSDKTDYTIEYILTPLTSKPKFLGLIGGGDRPSLSLRMDHSSTTPSPVEYTEIDVSNIDPGPYELTVRVTDKLTGEVRERTRPLELYEYQE